MHYFRGRGEWLGGKKYPKPQLLKTYEIVVAL